nr:MAG TPA: tail fiber protein [Bacteriophage sp.]
MAQDDANTRTIKASLWDGARPFSIPTECVCMVRFGKPDGTGGLYDTTEGGQKVSYSGNVVTAPVAAQMLTVAGVVKAQIDIYGGGEKQQVEKLATFRFRVEVEPSAYADAKIISSDYYNVLSSQIAAAVEAGAKADQAIQAAQQATNAASSASQSQTAAASSAQSASQSAQTASSAATSATSAKAAAESAQEAAQTANESAASSASSAYQDAQSAAQSAAAAMQDADDAEAWAVGKRNGTDVPSTDPAYHNNAKYYKDQAQTIAGGEFVSYGTPQSLTDAQQAQARDNINAPAPYEAGDNISITGNTIATKAFPCNPNLLDNWYFGNPVNQRGNTSYASGGYTVDRWKTSDGVTTAVANGELNISYSTPGWNLVEPLDNMLVPGVTYTLSCIYKASVNSIRLVVAWGDSQFFYNEASPISDDWALAQITGTIPANATISFNQVIIQPLGSSAGDFSLKAVKLELGSQQTLAHKEDGVLVLNEIPKLGDQLAACQRYQYPLCGGSSYAPIGYGFAQTESQARIFVPTGQKMRATPAVTYLTGGTNALRILGEGTAVPVTNIQADNFVSPMGNAAGVVLICTTNGGLTQRACYALTTLSADAVPMFDANL